jgi:hypothetical protein
MSMGRMGLLGALSGLGEGLSIYGKSMFDDAIEEKRQARLQAIRDKEYARGRADAVADRQVNQDFQTKEREARQGFQTSERIESQEFQSGQAQEARDARLSGMQVAADGTVYVLEGGELVNKGQIDVSDNRINNALKAYSELNRSLISQAATRDDPMFSQDFARLDALSSQVFSALEVDTSSPAQIWANIQSRNSRSPDRKSRQKEIDKFKNTYSDWYRDNVLGGN